MVIAKIFKTKVKLISFVLILSTLNFIFYNVPFVNYIAKNIDLTHFNGKILLVSLMLMLIILTALVFYIFLYFLRKLGKGILILFCLINAVALYFINTFGVIIDKSMIGNILNTNFDESSSFFSGSLVLYFLFLGVLPSIFIYCTKIIYPNFKKAMFHIFATLIFSVGFAYAHATNWLWIDKYSPTFGALVMPWSYVANTSRYYAQKAKENITQIILPDAKIKDHQKSVVVLVIGESARMQNFSLYGYPKNTNPLLSKILNVKALKSESCATNTISGVKCILEHKYTNKLYEPLPNYLYRNGVDVIWRTVNWGEPKIKVRKYLTASDLKTNCDAEDCNYDGVLLNGLEEEIRNSKKDKVLIILHTSTSHGPTYNKKYPQKFNKFTPVCDNVELSKCTQKELINAYDNTIVYTDYLLSEIINILGKITDFKSAMFYVSDHGESLGENNLYMHGLPKGIAPKTQFEIPFIVWTSEEATYKNFDNPIPQQYIFHSVLNFLAIDSEIYNEQMNIFKN